MDFTPGIFDIPIPEKPKNQVNTTLAKQLALYVVLYSPLQMAADLPEHYKNQPAFKFIEDVVVDWDTTLVLNGKIGEYITVARKDRNSNNWFVGSISNEKARDFTVKLDFLPANQKYEAQIYADGTNADYTTNPLSIAITKQVVIKGEELNLHLAPGGGQAIYFKSLD
jgi:alpha-glucosidase